MWDMAGECSLNNAYITSIYIFKLKFDLIFLINEIIPNVTVGMWIILKTIYTAVKKIKRFNKNNETEKYLLN